MTAQAASTARPPSTAIAWATRDGLFVEYSVKDGPPLIVRFRKTADGLAAALNILLEHPSAETYNVARTHPKTKFGPKASFTDEQRAGAREVLKKLGIT